MFCGAHQIRFVNEKFFWNRLAEFNAETPFSLFNHGAENQLRPVPDGQPQRARRHLKIPAFVKRHFHLFSVRRVNRHQQRIAGAKKLDRLRQLILMENNRPFGKKRFCILKPFQLRTAFILFTSHNGRRRKSSRAQPLAEQIIWSQNERTPARRDADFAAPAGDDPVSQSGNGSSILPSPSDPETFPDGRSNDIGSYPC